MKINMFTQVVSRKADSKIVGEDFSSHELCQALADGFKIIDKSICVNEFAMVIVYILGKNK
jgi:hypothetical protein